MRKIWSSDKVRRMSALSSRADCTLWPNGFSITTRRQNDGLPTSPPPCWVSFALPSWSTTVPKKRSATAR